MDREEFEKNWHNLKWKIQERWSRFTNDEIAKINGKFEQFLGHLQKKYGYTKEQAKQEMKNWLEDDHKKIPRKIIPQLSGEDKPSDLLAHEELAHEDNDPIYPFEPIQGEKSKDHVHKKKKIEDKKRKAG